VTGNAVHQSTKLGLISADNFLGPNENNALYQANVAEHYEPTPVPANNGFVTTMTNLATATSADREAVATLNKAIATLTDQLKAKDIWAKLQEAEVRHLLSTHGNDDLH
jgi:hypothetical protein